MPERQDGVGFCWGGKVVSEPNYAGATGIESLFYFKHVIGAELLFDIVAEDFWIVASEHWHEDQTYSYCDVNGSKSWEATLSNAVWDREVGCQGFEE